MRTITIDTRMINFTGIGTFLQNLIPFILNDFQVTLLGNPIEFERFSWDYKYEVVKMKSSIYSIKEQIELPQKINHCDLFISPHYNVPLLPIKAKYRLSVIHDVNHLVFRNKLNNLQKIYSNLMINSAVRISDKIITVSEFSKSEIIKHTDCIPDKIEIIYCAVNKSIFSTKVEISIIDKLKNDYTLPDRFCLFVGTGKHHKNLQNVLRALNILNSEGKNYNMVIVGKKDSFLESAEINELLKNKTIKNNIYFTNYLRDDYLPAIYKLATFLIFPSYYEGFGLPPLEAMSCGCPVLSSDSASLPEVCNDAALYFDPHNFNDIAEKMDLCFNDLNLQHNLKEKGFKNIQRFSWNESYNKFKKIIQFLTVSEKQPTKNYV